MTVGVIILAHAHLHRTRQLAAALANAGLRVAIHVDGNVPDKAVEELQGRLKHQKGVIFAPRIACDWGRFSLVRAGMGAAEALLKAWPGVSHVLQISGSCLPVRPLAQLQGFLGKHPGTDFVESTPAHENWVQGGLSEERFMYHFPFSWKRHRWVFDRGVDIQRALKVRRRVPKGIEPHLGSQWWCLCADTLRAILDDPRRPEMDRFFAGTWIPDESYVPTLVRKFSKKLEPRSLTLARFDDQGKPHVFYDDHEELLASSGAFFARKAWHGANRLYRRFLHQAAEGKPKVAQDLDEVFEKARARRCDGRPGLRNAGRFPAAKFERQPSTSVPYTVLLGFGQVFDGFQHWLGNTTGTVAHGRVFQQDRVAFSPRWGTPPSGLVANPAIRDMNPEQFMTNMLWAGQGRGQSLMFEIADGERMAAYFARDPNARIIAVQGSWMLDLFQRQHEDQGVLRRQAKRLEQAWAAFEGELAVAGNEARCSIIPLANLQRMGGDVLYNLQAEVSPGIALRPRALPPARDLGGLSSFLDRLHLMGIDTSALGRKPRRGIIDRIRARK